MNNIYYIDATTKQQFGPYTLDDLRGKNIAPETMVWASGMSDWDKAGNVQELQFLFSSNTGAVPPVPNSSQPASSNPNNGGYQSKFHSNVYGQPLNSSPNNGNGLQMPSEPMPKTWLPESIIFTILCCSPIALVGIYFASKVESNYRAGDYYSAVEASKNAKLLTLIGLGLALGGSIFYFLVILVSASA